jgi:intracellular sulfur oxidation DsrE/DsrF family protein
MDFSRRTFVSGVSSALTALGTLGVSPGIAEGQLIERRSDWNTADFDALLKVSARAKQVYDIRPIADGKFLSNVKNSLNGFHFGFGIPESSIKVVVGMHGPSNALNFSDAMWEKYKLGEWLQVTDPKTGKPAIRNLYYPKKALTSTDPEVGDSIYQDTSIEALQARGVQFLSCHTATEEQARALVEKYSLQVAPEEIVKDLQSHTVPGVMIVPAMVATISLLQSEGHYTYITV